MRSPLALMEPPLLSKQRGCVAAWHAGGLYGPSLSGASLRDFISNTHHAQFGSTSGADSNDPLQLLPENGKPYLYLPGIAANYASAPDEAALDITDDIDIRAEIAPTDWTPGAISVIAAKWESSGQGSWIFRLTTGGLLNVVLSSDGSSFTVNASSTAAVGVADGVVKHVRITAEIAAGAVTVTFYTSDDGSSWSQLGDTVAGIITAIFVSTASVEIGTQQAGTVSPLASRVYSAQVYDGIDGTKVLDIDFTDVAAYNATRTSLTAVTGQTVTINRSTSGRKSSVVDRPLILFGTDDLLEIANHADLNFTLGQGMTIVAAFRKYADFGAAETLVAKKTDLVNTAGYALYMTATVGAFRTGNGSASNTGTGTLPTAGEPSVLVGRISVAKATEYFLNGSIAANPGVNTNGPAVNSAVLRIGRLSGAGTSYFEGELFAAAIFRRTLSVSEVRQLNRELLGVPV